MKIYLSGLGKNYLSALGERALLVAAGLRRHWRGVGTKAPSAEERQNLVSTDRTVM
jgi:hypothetical protein